MCFAFRKRKTASRLGRVDKATGKICPSPWPEIACTLYFTANSFSHNFSDNLAPSSDNHTDLFFVAGSEM